VANTVAARQDVANATASDMHAPYAAGARRRRRQEEGCLQRAGRASGHHTGQGGFPTNLVADSSGQDYHWIGYGNNNNIL